MARQKAPQYGPTPIRLSTASMFTGGLNTRADAFQLLPDETPDCLDVDLQIGGGFLSRKVVAPWGSGNPPAPAQNMWAYASASIQQAVMQGTDGKLYKSTGTTWASVSATVRNFSTAAEMNGVLYVMDGTNAALAWDGTTATAEGVAWNATIGTEGARDGNVPLAALCCAHMGSMWIANTTEGGVNYPNRIRWSHPGFPEDWRQSDFIDIDVGRDGDVITAIVEFRERLYIFKNNSTYELSGYSPLTYQVVPIAQNIGCVGPLALALTEVGLFTFSWPEGVFIDEGTGPYPIFDKIWPMIRDEFIPPAARGGICMGYVNKLLFVGVPWGSSTVNTRTLVYDPWIWKNRYLRFKQGPWYPYTLPLSCLITLETANGYEFLGAHSSIARVGLLDQIGGQDNWGGGTTVNLDSYYVTNWMDGGQEAVKKRWRRPEFVMRTGDAGNIVISVARDYDGDGVYVTYQISQTGVVTTGLIWDDGTSSFGLWDDGTGMVGGMWNDPSTRGEIIEKGAPMGTCRAVQLTFTGPVGVAWGIDAITLKFVPIQVTG